MSEYGRLYEQVKEIIARLKAIQPNIKTNFYADAKATADMTRVDVALLMYNWGELEKEMAKCDDNTGEP